jgi:hypothetical protein
MNEFPNCNSLVEPGATLLIAEDQIHYPTAANVGTRLTAMPQDFGIRAARFFQGVGKDRHSVEGSFIVDCLRHTDDRAGQPGLFKRDWTEGVANDVAQEFCLLPFLDILSFGVFPVDLGLALPHPS